MGINMDIRNEPEYAFLDLGGLDDAAKNEIRAILRPNTGLDSLKLPWDIGEKEYELESEIVENPSEESSENQWQQYGMTEGMANYEGCGVQATTMMPPGIPAFPSGMIAYVRDFTSMGNPFGNNAGGDPNAYSYVSGFQYAPTATMYPSNSEQLMNQPTGRENERRGRGRGGGGGGGGGGGKRDSYNRMLNSNNDIQTGYLVPGQHQFGQMVPMSGALYSVTAQAHPAAGPPIFLQAPASAYPQGPPQMHHNSHASYGHHPSNYQSHPHSSASNKYVRPNQMTYYNQDNTKNSPKNHEKRSHQQEIPNSTPPFRHPTSSNSSNSSSSTNNNNNNNNNNSKNDNDNNNDAKESPKRNYGKSLIVDNNSSSIDAKNISTQSNLTRSTEGEIKVPILVNHAKIANSDVERIKNETSVDKKDIHRENVDDNGITSIKEKIIANEKEVSCAREKVSSPKSHIESQPRMKIVESSIDDNEVAIKNIPDEDSKVAEIAPVTLPISTVPISVPVAVSSVKTITWANVLKKKNTPGGDSGKSPIPITRLPVGRVPPINFSNPPAPVESATMTKVTSQEAPRNETFISAPTSRNNVEAVSKITENSAWAENKIPTETSQQNNLNDPAVFRMGELLLKYQMDKQTVSLLPRGLTNRSNYCYINSILQALLACPPFYNLLMALPYPRNSMKNSSTPLIDNMVRFVREFNPLAEGARMPRKDKSQKRGEETAVDVQCGIAFEPSYVYTMLKNTSCAGVFSVEGRQEDAEEFLSCLLNGISDEMLELMKLVNSESSDTASEPTESNVNFSNAEEGWKVMGPKNKGSITRCTEFGRTPLSDIFRGQLRSRVLRTGDETTDNVQPFFTLQLDIEKAESVEGALEILVGKDQVEGMTCSKTKQQIEAWKQVLLEELPVILILHLKWFDYKLDGCSKIFKRVGFPIDLKLDGKLLSPNVAKKLIRKQKQYKLFAVTYHDGKEASKGHYVTDAFHVGYNAWVRYDDSSVKGIYEMDVLNPSPPRVPYLLYYRRCDTIGNNPPTTTRPR